MTMTDEARRAAEADRARADTDAALAVERALSAQERQAILDYAGPRLKGAQVADVLTIAVDSDANLGLTEPFFDEHGDALADALDYDRHDGGGGYAYHLRAFLAAFSVQSVAILTRKVPGRDHVISLAVDALKIATGEADPGSSEPDEASLSIMEARRTPHKFEGTAIACTACGLADGAVVHREPSPAPGD